MKLAKLIIWLGIITLSILLIIGLQKKLAPKPLYAIITPMPSEATYIRQHIKNPKIIKRLGLEFLSGKIGKHRVISAISGYGKVNVTAVTSRLIEAFHPTAIILVETSGSVNKQLKIGAVVVGQQVFDADFGQLTAHGPELPILIANPINQKKEPLVFAANQKLLDIAKTVMTQNKFDFTVVTGALADGDVLPNPEWQLNLLRANKVQAIAMDGAPVAKLGWIFNIPCLVIHSIANVAGLEITDAATEIAANNAGKFTLKLIEQLS